MGNKGIINSAATDLLTYLTEGQYEKDFDPMKSAAFVQIMGERQERRQEAFKEEWYKYMKYKLPELFAFLEKDPKRYVLKPGEDGETFNIEVKIYKEDE